MTLKKMIGEHALLQDTILKKMDEMNDGICACKKQQELFTYVHHGNRQDEIIDRCVTCGGYVLIKEK